MKRTAMFYFGALATLLVVKPINAQTIADWTFETSQPAGAPGANTAYAGFSPEIGSGTASGLHAGAATYSTPAGNGSSHSFSVNTWAVGDYFQFDFSTLGYTGVQISFDQTSSNTGPGTFGLFASVNGGAYTQIGANYTVLANASPNPTWNATTSTNLYTFTPNVGSLLDNATTVSLRLVDQNTVSANGGTVAASGTDRVDNFIVSVAAVPEPTTVALMGMGLAGLFSLRRKR